MVVHDFIFFFCFFFLHFCLDGENGGRVEMSGCGGRGQAECMFVNNSGHPQFFHCLICKVRWPTTVTSKPNAHSKLQSAHIKFKSLTSNSNRSHQIQIAHSKFKSLTANSNYSQQITNHSQQITNRSQQIQIAHSKFKSPTAN